MSISSVCLLREKWWGVFSFSGLCDNIEYRKIMRISLEKTIFVILAILILPGCSFFNGEYQTPPSPEYQEENTADFNSAQKQLEKRLDDMASGKAQMGEPEKSATTSAESLAGAVNQTNNSDQSNMPQAVIQQGKTYSAVLHTEAGDITIALAADKTPFTVNNFVYLSKVNFYNNTIFHRIIDGFMIQGGDPKGDGTGGPGYQFADEEFEGSYTRGTVAMANSGPNTNGSQFFIMHKDYPLSKNYVIFGHVISGMDTVDKIATAPVEMSASGEKSKPSNPIKITSIDIIEK